MVCRVIDFRQASNSPLNPFSARLRLYLREQLLAAQNDATVVRISGRCTP